MNIDNLIAEGRQLLTDAVTEACRSADPAVAELAQEIAAGRITAREALTGPTYGDLLQTSLESALRHLERPDEATTADHPDDRRASPDTASDEKYFSSLTVLRRNHP